MADQVTNYQCPNCTGPLHFNGKTGKLECDYCGSSYEVSQIEALYAQKDAKATQAMQEEDAKHPAEKQKKQQNALDGENESAWDLSGMSSDWGKDAAGMKVYNCPSCGAELICDESTAATSCPYCGNPTVVPGKLAGALKPNYVIPFKLSKEDAKEALKKHYKGKTFLPRAFSSENHLEEMKGIYVPFWMFDGAAEGWVKCDATRIQTHRSGDYEITETDHFDVYREGSLAFSKIPVDASGKMPDDYMDSVEPYDYRELKDFSTAYLPGFLADKYDVAMEESQKRADTRCENTLVATLESTIRGYAGTAIQEKSVKLHRGRVYYALLPVWTLHTKWNGKDFLFVMNGQTGKLVGDLPVSKGKFWGLLGAVAGVLSAVSITLVMLLT